MPIYEYRCSNGHQFEVIQRMSDDPVEACEQCGAPVERVFHPVAVHFKGSGFYTTDYAKKSSAAGSGKDGGGSEDGSPDSGGEGASKSASKSDSKSASKSDSKSKPDSKPAKSGSAKGD